jgi:hypothetical protein
MFILAGEATSTTLRGHHAMAPPSTFQLSRAQEDGGKSHQEQHRQGPWNNGTKGRYGIDMPPYASTGSMGPPSRLAIPGISSSRTPGVHKSATSLSSYQDPTLPTSYPASGPTSFQTTPRIDTPRPPRAASQVAAQTLTEYYAQRGPSLSSSTHPSAPPGPQTGPIAPWDVARYTAIPGSSRTPISTGPPNHTSSTPQPQDAQTAPRDLAQTPTPLDHSSRSFIPLGPTLRPYSPPQPHMPVLGSYSSPQPSVAHGKRKADQVSFRSSSPPRTRIKSEPSDSPTRAYRESSAFEGFVRDLTPLANKIDCDARRADARRATASLDVDPSEAKKVLILDPRNKDYFWQIRCLSKGFLRNRICSYLGLGSVQALRTWEEVNPLRWTHIQLWLSMPHFKVTVIDVLRIVCNDGGPIADVLAYMEHLKPWNWPTGASFNANAGTVALALTVDIRIASATLQMACIIVWMIRDSPKQFRNSNHFGTKFFWYSPEDINRSFWYLSSLVAQPIDRMIDPGKRPQDVNMGVDAGKASLHNSVSAGVWSKRVAASKIHTIHCRVQEEGNGGRPSFLPDAVDGCGTPVDSSNESAAVQDLAVTAPQN